MTVLFVIATIILFLSADWFVRRMRGEATVTAEPQRKTYPIRLPEGIFFAPSHTWLSLYPSGKIRLGIDDFIARLLDHPEITYLKTPGDRIRKGEGLMQLREGKHSLTIRSPLEGEIVCVNEELPGNPSLLEDQLFSAGWGFIIKPSKLSELKHMLLGTETKTWIGNEFQRLRDLFASLTKNGSVAPAFLQDGGPPIAGVMSTMDDAVWQQLDNEFLQVK